MDLSRDFAALMQNIVNDTMGKVISSRVPSPDKTSDKKPWIACIQWNGENFEAIEKAVKTNLSGYVYRLDDDLILEYNDGYSIKRIKALDWILVLDEDNDISVMSDKMFNIFLESTQSECLDLSGTEDPATLKKKEEEKPVVEEGEDPGVDLSVRNQYGDDITLIANKDELNMKFSSYHGDKVTVSWNEETQNTKIYMNDRYGNILNVRGIKMNTTTKSTKTSAEMFLKVYNQIERAKSITNSLFDKAWNLSKKAQEKAG